MQPMGEAVVCNEAVVCIEGEGTALNTPFVKHHVLHRENRDREVNGWGCKNGEFITKCG